MESLEELIRRVKRDVLERRAKCTHFDGARQLFHPATWAQEAATVYEFVPALDRLGVQSMAPVLLGAVIPPSVLYIHPDHMEAYLETLSSGTVQFPGGNHLMTYADIFVRDTPPHPSLLMIEDGNAFLDYLHAQGKSVQDFYQWSVGYYPLPHLHTHLIFQLIVDEG